MKGVSEVIAIILILMIVIALAALAYTWFSGIFATLTGTASTSITTTTQQMQVQFRMEGAACIDKTVPPDGDCADDNGLAADDQLQFTIRNTGSARFNPAVTTAYINGNYEGLTAAMAVYGGGAACLATTFDNGCTATFTKSAPLTTTPVCTAAIRTLKVVIATGITDTITINCV